MKAFVKALALVPVIAMAGVATAAAECDMQLIKALPGKYVGQQSGFRNEMTVTSVDAENCSVMSTWQVLRDEAPAKPGAMELTLDEETLTGTWTSGADTGQARFIVRRSGQHWNGRLTGWKDQPPGPWDYIKVVKPQ